MILILILILIFFMILFHRALSSHAAFTAPWQIMQSSTDDPMLAVLLELGAVVVELFEARDLLRAETPYAAFRASFRWFWAYWHRGGGRVAPTEAGQANDEDRAAGVEVAPGAAEDAALVRLRIRFCQDTLITNQMAEGESHACVWIVTERNEFRHHALQYRTHLPLRNLPPPTPKTNETAHLHFPP